MSSNRKQNHPGFTLIELIVTMTIIILLAGLVVGGFGFVRDKQKLETAKVQIALLARGLDEYKLDMGVFPGEGSSTEFGGDATSVDGENSEVIYQALFFDGWDFLEQGQPTSWENHRATTIYVAELDPTTTNFNWVARETSATPPQNLKIIDPWENQYRYRVGSNATNPGFDLWSAGPDGETSPGSSGSPYDPRDDRNRDDIRN